MIQTINREHYKVDENGKVELIKTETFDLDLPTDDELIVEKESQLLSLYDEIQKLKENKG